MKQPVPLLAALLATACTGPLPQISEEIEGSDGVGTCGGKCDAAAALEPVATPEDAPLATLFSPADRPLGSDLELIGRVIAARAADPAAYAEGDNPFSIKFAVYNLAHPDLVSALADAEDHGVDVQILIESEQLDPARGYNTSDDFLVGRGFELVRDHRGLTDDQLRTADIVGIVGDGLMHLKTRLYSWIDPATGAHEKRLVTGSMNPGDLAVFNDETLHVITLPDLIAQYERKYGAVLRDEAVENTWTDGAPVQVLFSPDPGVQTIDRITWLIDHEEEMILVAVFTLRNPRPRAGGKGILDRLIAAKARGVPVVVITDRKQSDGIDANGASVAQDDSGEDALRSAGIPVYEVMNRDDSPYNAMHTKYAVFGLTRPIVVTDAGNWTRASFGSGTSRPQNDESVLFIDSNALDEGRTARRYLGHFLHLVWKYGSNGTDGQWPTGGPDPRELVATLSTRTGWPTVSVTLRARGETAWGERLAIAGDDPALGAWDPAAALPLETDASSYPVWTAAPLTLPLGARIEAKLIRRPQSGAPVWEQGDNRRIEIDPTPLALPGGDPDGRAMTTEMSWR